MTTRLSLVAAAVVTLSLSGAFAKTAEEEAHAIGVDAYLYFYPLVTMDVTRKQLTNQEASPGGIGGPMNRFANVGAFPTADMKVVVRPNFDTLYSLSGHSHVYLEAVRGVVAHLPWAPA